MTDYQTAIETLDHAAKAILAGMYPQARLDVARELLREAARLWHDEHPWPPDEPYSTVDNSFLHLAETVWFDAREAAMGGRS